MAHSAPPLNPLPTPTPPATMPLISPHTVLYSTLSRSPPTRPSGRSPSQSRPISLNTSSLTHAHGSALVKIGQTSAVCGVRGEILPVHEIASYRVNKAGFTTGGDGAGSGALLRKLNLLVPNVELSTGCSPYHLPGSPPSVEAQSLAQRLLSFLRVSGVIRLEDLAIYTPLGRGDQALDRRLEATETATDTEMPDTESETHKTLPTAYWVLYIDTVVINHDGNLFDACALAMVAALQETELPRVWRDEDTEGFSCDWHGMVNGLGLRAMPVPLSFAVFKSNKLEEQGSVDSRVEQVLCDPDAMEQNCCNETGCVVVDRDAEGGTRIIRIEKHGGGIVAGADLGRIVDQASERWKQWQEVLRRRLSA